MPRQWARITTPDGFKNGVGERVQERRLALGLTQMALGGRIAFYSEGRWSPSEDELYGLERRARLVTDLEVKVLAISLECSILYLMGEDSARPAPASIAHALSTNPKPRRRTRKARPSDTQA